MSVDIPTQTRPLGRTGFSATRLGIGDLADRNIPLDQCVAMARRALDLGLNLIDTAPGYEDGYSEMIVGRAVAGRRDGLFIVDKIDHFDQPVASQIDASLGRLNLEHTDAFVLHGLSTLDAWSRATAPGGLMDQLGAAIKAGKTRFRGISCHNPEVLRLAVESGRCDVVMFPVGAYVDERYLTNILPLAKKHSVGVVAFKTFGAGKLLGDTEGYQRPLSNRPRGKLSSGGLEAAVVTLPRLSVEECVHYTLTCDPDVALLGMSFPNEQDAALAGARSFRGLSAAAMADIKRRGVEAIRGKGACWWNPDPQAQ